MERVGLKVLQGSEVVERQSYCTIAFDGNTSRHERFVTVVESTEVENAYSIVVSADPYMLGVALKLTLEHFSNAMAQLPEEQQIQILEDLGLKEVPE